MHHDSEVKPPAPGDARRALPGVGRLASRIRELAPELPAWAAVPAARRAVAEARRALGGGAALPGASAGGSAVAADPAAIEARALALARVLARPHPTRVVNATGVVLHTNLGRAVLGAGAAEAVALAARHPTSLELDLASGGRGQRLGPVPDLLIALSGAEAAWAVNNNAAAVLLALNTLAEGREVVVSRGELVEIGGSFRVPAILERAGVRMVEVGTTNRTHPDDYRRAITPRTGLLLKVHASNFEQRGFVAEVDLPTLVGIGRDAGVPVVEDLGSATLVDLRARGLPEGSYAPARLATGVDLVCFSGDKLCGGPQAGILLGRPDVVEALRRNPLARALRLDKLTLAALDATLRCQLEGRLEELPTVRQLLEPAEDVAKRAAELAARLEALAGGALGVELAPCRAPVGGGSLPGFALDSTAVVLRPPRGAAALAEALRGAPVPVLARVRDGAVHLDARTLQTSDLEACESALATVLRDPRWPPS